MLKILIADGPDGAYQPIALVEEIHEGKDLAALDFAQRMDGHDNGEDPFCPESYRLWNRTINGSFIVMAVFTPEELTEYREGQDG